jgi:hypothetical protein
MEKNTVSPTTILDATFDVLVNYDEPLYMKAARLCIRGLTFASESITTENYPTPAGRSGTVRMQLSFPKSGNKMTTDAAEQFVEQRNLEVGDPYQLLDWIDQYWGDLQEQMVRGLYVAALTPSSAGNRVVCISYDGSGHELLNCDLSGDAFGGHWRFVGFHTEPSNT